MAAGADPEMSAKTVLPGYRVKAVEDWIRINIPTLEPPLDWSQLEGGHSNITCRVVDQNANVAVIRRPPEGELHRGAHDMSREWSVISALQNTGVPVPQALGFCEDPDVTGAWFYVMGWVSGTALYSRADTERVFPAGKRPDAARAFIQVLANLHLLNPGDQGLGELGKQTGYLQRQLGAWYRSWNTARDSSGLDDPRIHEMYNFLAANIPDQGPARIVHGDYNLHNVMFGPGGEVTAVLDWEICTLGDPLADLAYALNCFADPADAVPAERDDAGATPGFSTRAELAAHYAALTGADISNLDYYVAFNRWKSASISQGVQSRYIAGNKDATGIDMQRIERRRERAFQLAAQAIDRLSQSS